MKKIVVHKLLQWSLKKSLKYNYDSIELDQMLRPLYVRVVQDSLNSNVEPSKEVQVKDLEKIKYHTSTQTLFPLLEEYCIQENGQNFEETSLEIVATHEQKTFGGNVEKVDESSMFRMGSVGSSSQSMIKNEITTETNTFCLIDNPTDFSELDSNSPITLLNPELLEESNDEGSTLHICVSLSTDEIPVSEGVQCDRTESPLDTISSISIIPYLPDVKALPLISDLVNPREDFSDDFSYGESTRL